MCLISYHASQEQFSPADLLEYVVKAEAVGFNGIHSSDHFHPWSKRQGQSGFTFSWISAAMQICKLPFSMVCAPGQRLHPAIVAQAISTVATMYPGRLIVELGSGEAINEAITGDPWPEKHIRNERLLQCKHVIAKLLNGEKINFSGLVRVQNARLYTLPPIIPPLFCAALSKETAEWAGSWADGLLTTADVDIELTKSKVDAFRKGRSPKLPVHLQLSFCYGRTRREAVTEAYDQWKSNMVGPDKLANLSDPEKFDQLAASITKEDVEENTLIITDMEDLKERIAQFNQLTPSSIHLHNISRNQKEYLNDADILFK